MTILNQKIFGGIIVLKLLQHKGAKDPAVDSPSPSCAALLSNTPACCCVWNHSAATHSMKKSTAVSCNLCVLSKCCRT